MINRKQFLGAFLSDRHVAAVQPSSPFLIRRLLRRIDASKVMAVIELGPGDGVATLPLLKALPADARYLAIERNHAFCAGLAGVDPRLDAVEGDVRDLRKIAADKNMEQVDLVLASVPFTYLSKDERESVIAAAKSFLRPGGQLIVFHQYSPLMLPVLRRHFSSVKTEIEPWNLPPCFLFDCQNTAN
ncbi:methyltransferase domain-containing protein [Candidatus Uhrbacteria bacterium]|nr:methyltransferase domain-containing protein [Candidatus Uhrbacteria bacterium]